ncbi:MAG: glycosyltransferase [Patescibacteria group bacterium]|nr:glycosyltransferase [Patescibacteria group bacterium]
MRVAIVHDYIKEYGGAERVLEKLHEVFPDAPIYTTVYLPSFLGPHKKRFEGMNIKTSFLQFFPFKSKLISPFRLLAQTAFRSFDFSAYDVIIVSQTGSYFPNAVKKRGAKLICYCHTPPRYLYGFETARDWKKNKLFMVLSMISIHFLRMTDFKSSQNVDYFIANSENVRKRIQKFYRKDAVVIYPPVSVGDGRGSKIDGRTSKTEDRRLIHPQSSTLKNLSSALHDLSSREYYLAGGRLARPKHVDLIVETFSKLNLPLKIFGKEFAGHGEELKSKIIHSTSSGQKSKIEFLGEITDEEKYELMKRAKAFVFASEDEDFGITPVEAESLGTPVIAFASGGTLETVVDGKTGVFFNKLSVESLSKAIEKFNKAKFNIEVIRNQGKKFSESIFKSKIKEFVASKIK